MFENFLDEFIPAKKLRDYLKREPIYDSQVADIIFYAKAPLQRKREALFALENMEIPEHRKYAREYWLKYRESIDEAFSMLNSDDAVFVVYEHFIYEDNSEPEEFIQDIFSTYDAALSFVRNDSETCDYDENLVHWNVINLLIKGEDDSYKDTCSYYIIDKELCYFQFDFSRGFSRNCLDGELRLPVHYKPGDIMVADNYPFGRKIKFVILQIGDNMDCCCLQALSLRKDGTWDVGAVKHGSIGNMNYPKISPLYTADIYEPDLSNPEDAILAEVSGLVSGDENRGRVLWNKIAFNSVSSTEKMWEILKNPDLFKN